jgi:anti-anti-sigma factor
VSDEYHVIRFEGSLDISRYPEFRTIFAALPSKVPILVDLTAVDNVDSTFLTEMLMARRRHPEPFSVVIAPSGHVAKVFEITGLGAKMSVFLDLAAAIKSLRPTADRDSLRAD